ncbi:MAG: response regulator transcription factor, partial [Cupriavidus sp.]|nr:response regulator transcription factor [Cupriavidus sp.]
MIRVVIADDHAVVRNGLRHILEREDDVEVVGEAAKGSEVPQVLRETTPDVILLDLSMPGRSGLELVRHVRTEYPASRVLVLTMHAEE